MFCNFPQAVAVKENVFSINSPGKIRNKWMKVPAGLSVHQSSTALKGQRTFGKLGITPLFSHRGSALWVSGGQTTGWHYTPVLTPWICSVGQCSHRGSALWVSWAHTANRLQKLCSSSQPLALLYGWQWDPSSHPLIPFAALQIEDQTQIFLRGIQQMFSVTRAGEHKWSEDG